MPDMDGFKLLEQIGLEMDLPVISKFPAQSLQMDLMIFLNINVMSCA
jgi:two-component response regulator (ARR-B family)